MARLSKRLRNGEDGGLMFWCPGCDGIHGIKVGEGAGLRWRWNGSVDHPTFSPSILVSYTHWWPPATDDQVLKKIRTGEIVQTAVKHVCHSFVTDGKIQFLADSTHHLAGQTVDMPDFDDEKTG